MVESFASGRHTSALPPSFRLSGTAFALACAGLLGGALLPLAARAQTAAAPSAVSATALPEVQVTASAEEAKNQGHTTTITAEDLQKQGAASMADVVRYQPLVSAPETASGTGNLWDGAGTPGYNVRGLEGNRVALEVDGIELPPAEIKPDGMSTSSFSTDRDTLETDLFQQVEIASGATAAGRAGSLNLGGRVSFTTKSPEDFLRDGKQSHLGYKFGYQSANKSRAHTLTGATQIGAVQALGIYVRRDGEQAKSEGDIAPNPQDWDSNALLTKFVWGAHTGNRLGLSVEHFDRGTQYTNTSEVTASMPQAPQQDATDRRSRISLEHRYTPAQGLAVFDSLESRIYYQSAEAKNLTFVPEVIPRAGARYARHLYTNSEYDTWGASADASKSLGAHTLYYGLSYTQTDSQRPWEETRTDLSGVFVSQTIKDRASAAKDARLSLYVRDEIALNLGGRRVKVTPGLTVQHQRVKPTDQARYAQGSGASAGEVRKSSDTALLPSLNVSLELAPQFDAYAHYSRGVRRPSITELTGSFENPGTGYAVLGNPDLDKETSQTLELGVRGQAAKGITLNASAFYSRYKNFIEYENIGRDPNLPQFGLFVYRAHNIGKAEIWGTELSSRFDLGVWAPSARGLSVNLAGGWSQGSAQNTRTGNRGWLPSVLPAKVVAGLAYDDPSKRFGTALHASHTRSKQASDAASASTTEYFAVPSATVLDLTAYWNLNRNVTWNVGIYNLSDRKYWDYASVRSLAANATADIQRQTRPGRSFGTSLEVKF